MAKITLLHGDGNGFRPPCFAPINAYKASFHQNEKSPHPIGAFNHSWAAVLSPFEECFRTLDALRLLSASDGAKRSELEAPLVSAMRDLYYRATEFLEHMEDAVSHGLSTNTKHPTKFSGPSSYRKQLTIPCNKLKHNHNRIHYVQASYVGTPIPGFTIYHVKNGALEPNPEIHKKRRSFSFAVELRRIFAAIYFFMLELGNSVNRHCVNEIRDTTISPDDPRTIALIKKLQQLPHLAMPFETNRDMPIILLDETGLLLANDGGVILPAPANSRMTATFVGDGFTNKFGVP